MGGSQRPGSRQPCSSVSTQEHLEAESKTGERRRVHSLLLYSFETIR